MSISPPIADIIDRLICLIALLAACSSAHADRPASPTAPDETTLLARRYEELLPPGSTVGIRITSLGTGRVLFAHNDSLALIPASTMKLLVTAHALDHWDTGWDSTIAAALAVSTDRRQRLLSDSTKQDSLALLLETTDLETWPLLRRTIIWTNRHSDNRTADLLMTTALGERQPQRPGETYTAWLAAIGVSSAGLRIADGSGLSRRNRLTARTLTDLLAVRHRMADTLFYSSLAIPGRRGTLVRRGLGLSQRVRAKTGYLRGIFTLAGYLAAETDTFAFAFLANDCPEARDAYRLFTGLLLTTYRLDADQTAASRYRRTD